MSCLFTNCDKRNYGHKLWRIARHGIKDVACDLRNTKAKIALINHNMADVFRLNGIPSEKLIDIPNPCVPFTTERVRVEKNKEFVFIGRLVEEKGIECFLSAARKAGVKARVIGDGPLAKMLADRFPETVFEGWCDRDKLKLLAQSARMLVVPSIYPEPFGLVVVEAASSGIPVMISESAFLASEITGRRIGCNINPKDLDSFASKLRQYSIDDILVQESSERAFSTAAEYSLNVEQWSALLQKTYETMVSTGEEERPHQ